MKQKIIVQGVLVDNNKVLLAKRADPTKAAYGKYHIPGGHVEYGETPESAIIREFQEELNLEVAPQVILRSFSYIFNEVHTVGIVYSLSCEQIPAAINFDKSSTSEVVWVSIKDLKEYMPADDNDYITLTKYLKH